MCDECTNGGIENDLLASELLILVDSCGILSVIAILDLYTLNLLLVEPEVSIRDVVKLLINRKL